MNAVKAETLFERKILVKLPLLQFGLHVADVVCRFIFCLFWDIAWGKILCCALMQEFRGS